MGTHFCPLAVWGWLFCMVPGPLELPIKMGIRPLVIWGWDYRSEGDVETPSFLCLAVFEANTAVGVLATETAICPAACGRNGK